ncbi:ArsR/SmtB family transcription factor [Reichenbachiella versicolor]|uniref:ArsR/SmtB family transcription factor n=1 Tax=Reichenbachiella versicolor TaxID=1821036 RepID=UPI000D6E8564|nr:metalloregulator ArsR/SmtB family transcription factor [Reichenbachiella versicolor]
MGITKTSGFDDRTNDLAQIFKAIGHPARWSILEYVAQSPECICNDLVDELPLAQPTISQHLSELKKVGLIQGTIEGKNICYCINEAKWNELKEALNSVSELVKKRNTCC